MAVSTNSILIGLCKLIIQVKFILLLLWQILTAFLLSVDNQLVLIYQKIPTKNNRKVYKVNRICPFLGFAYENKSEWRLIFGNMNMPLDPPSRKKLALV